MDPVSKLKTVFLPEAIHKEFYTGGVIELSQDGTQFLCQCRGHITIVEIETGYIIRTIPAGLTEYNALEDESDEFQDHILTFALSCDSEMLATAHKSGLIKLWNWKNSEEIKTWKGAHQGPVVILAFNNSGSTLATGGTDSSIRIWDTKTSSSLFKLGGLQGVTRVLRYYIVEDQELLVTSGNEMKIFVWNLTGNKKELLHQLCGHFSVVTNVLLSNDKKMLISCGRDKVIVVWNLENGKQVKTLPVYESIEASTMLSDCIHLPGYEKPVVSTLIAVAGEKGIVHIWDVINGKELFSYPYDTSEQHKSVTHLIYNSQQNYIAIITSDHNIALYTFETNFSCKKQIVGYSDEILDVTYFGENESHLAVATNSNNINVYDHGMNCSLLRGHTDFVISLASLPKSNILLSGSKDNSIRVWSMMKDANDIACVATATRHTSSVTSLALFGAPPRHFIVSGSEDTTIKLWQLEDTKLKKAKTLNLIRTEIAHDKTVNSVCVSPNDKFIATGSQDKTAKLWSATDLSLIGTLRGHRRGIWCVKFSPVDQVLLTSSADSVLRLWSISDLSCFRTFEGHSCSVLKCAFINNGMQIISSDSSGLVKLWNAKTSENIAVLDKHADKVWALAVSQDETKFVTGGADSRLVVWRDNTKEEFLKNAETQRKLIEQEQLLSNLLQMNQLLPALKLSLTLNRPGQAFKIIQSIPTKNRDMLESLINGLETNDKEILLKFASMWNTTSKHCYAAQLVLSLLKDDLLDGTLKISDSMLEGILAYTNRHFNRLAILEQSAYRLSYLDRIMEQSKE